MLFGQAVLVWLVIEYLVYQARYQWNDIRGFAADQAHPDRQSRGRLPGPIELGRRNRTLSLVVSLARLAAAAVIILLLSARSTPIAGIAAAAVLIVALGYETLRSVAAVPGQARAVTRTRPAVLALWLVSGLGYLVRGLTGLALGVDLHRHWQLGLVAGCALWAGGVGFVTARWAVESIAFGRPAAVGSAGPPRPSRPGSTCWRWRAGCRCPPACRGSAGASSLAGVAARQLADGAVELGDAGHPAAVRGRRCTAHPRLRHG